MRLKVSGTARIDLHKLWNAAKKTDPALAWWGENSKCAYQEAFRDLDRALRDYIKSKKGERKGSRLGFPKAKKRGKCRDSFRFGAGAIRCAGATVTLPRLGTIRTHESTRKLARRLETGTARILSATVSRTAQRWFVSFTVEVQTRRTGTSCPAGVGNRCRPRRQDAADRGGRPGQIISDQRAESVPVVAPQPTPGWPRAFPQGEWQREPAKGGSGTARAHPRPRRERPLRCSAQGTSDLAARYETVVAEDLNVTGMLANRTLARAVADQGFGAGRRMLGYKTTWNGGTLLVADRWYPSSKTCSTCGWRKPSLTLAERTFTCEACGLVMDRDENAARNLLALRIEAGADSGTASGAGTGRKAYACGDRIRPGLAGQWPQPPAGDEAGTRHRKHG